MWIETTPWIAVMWTFGSLLAHTGLQVYLHTRKRTFHVSELRVSTRSEKAATLLLAVFWLLLLICVFSDLDLSRGTSFFTWFGLTLDLRSFLSCLTTFTIVSVLFFGTFLQYAVTDELQTFLNSLNWEPAFGAGVMEVMFRGCGAGLLRAAGVASFWTTILVTLWSGLASLHFLYYLSRLRTSRHGELLDAVLLDSLQAGFIGLMATRLYILTGRIYPGFLFHVMVTYVGVPNCYFLYMNHPAYRHRKALGVAYVAGAAAFLTMYWFLIDPSAYDSLFYRLKN